ncbi:MAG: ScpA family protein [Ahrensia sp.]
MAANGTTSAVKKAKSAPMDSVWQDTGPERTTSDPALVVDVEGFEGPLDLLLHLARNQKVDLTQISVLELVRQYLKFIESARSLRIELAADYLVTAAWLAYLKSRLLIPKPKGEDGPSGDEMAAVLQFRLRRLEAMRDASSRLINRNRLGRDVFARGMPEAVIIEKKSEFYASLYDLLGAYAQQRQRGVTDEVHMPKRTVWSLKDARQLLQKIIGTMSDWTAIDSYLLDYIATPQMRASARASSFAASLEMVREGQLDIRQDKPFDTIYLRDAVRKNAAPQETAS